MTIEKQLQRDVDAIRERARSAVSKLPSSTVKRPTEVKVMLQAILDRCMQIENELANKL